MLKHGLPVLLWLLISLQLPAQKTVQFTITSLPAYHSAGSHIYLAGSFNGWNPADARYRFENNTNNQYVLQLSLPPGTYEYKITRGSWEQVECTANGQPTGNRQLLLSSDTALHLSADGWQDHFGQKKLSTASPQVCIYDTAFFIPQLNRARAIRIYVPADYCSTKKKYPVLYMHDGQNLFDNATSFSGEWGVDEFLDSTVLSKCIVVGIDNGGAHRLTEYNPYDHDRFGKGEGNAYAGFLVHTLKPFIDKHYRTLRKKKDTWIAGSSMGGLISFYTVLAYPKTFGAAGVFSPAFWTASGIDETIKQKGKKLKSRIYFYGGKQEGETMIPDMLRVQQAMAATSSSATTTVIRDEGKHNEARWQKEFPLFYEWLLKTK